MKAYFLILATALGISEPNAKMDLRYEAFFRPYPLGGFVRVDAGYGQRIWGSDANNSPLYGMIRPHIQLQNSGLITSARSFLELHPISFWSLYVGKEYTHRSNNKLATYDCEKVYCDTGLFERNHWGTKLAMKIKKVFYLGRFQWQTTIFDNNPFAYFAEEQGTLLGRGNRDTLFYQMHVLGYELNPIQSIGLLYKRNRIKSTHQSTIMAMLIYRHQFTDPFHPDKGRNFSLTVGPGLFQTRQNTTHPSFMASILYNWDKGLTLF